jgi:hypothetical protein
VADRVTKNNIYNSFSIHFFLFLKVIFHWHVPLAYSIGMLIFIAFLVSSLPPYCGLQYLSRLSFPFLYFTVQSDFFCVVNYLFHTFFPVDPLFFLMSIMFVLWPSVSFHSHSMWSTGRWVLQVLSLDIASCSFLGIPFVSSSLTTSRFLSFISLFPFFHL